MARDYRVLSIQSHVVSGYVGNKSACFPLQVLGFEVDLINSVQFSNHTGYPSVKGQVLNADELQDLYEGLKLNRIHKYSHVLTGYVGSLSFLSKVVDIIQELKRNNPSLMYVCDPVLGDNGSMYVPQELIPVYKDSLTLLADIVTPNQFELELLSEMQVTNETTALEAMDVLHNRGIQTVIVSSCKFPENEKELVLFGSTKKGAQRTVVRMDIPVIEVTFTGTGDLFTACILAWMTKTNNLKEALEKTVATVQGVLQKTYKHAQDLSKEPDAKPQPSELELRLIQSKEHIENPHSEIKATKIV